ncbi:TLC domain-containing protein [Nemania sp. NC0429]|nr:TLC domain-containing protein [Nemania sp. NC0429]
METRSPVDNPAGSLHPTASTRNLHQRRLPAARSRDGKAGDVTSIPQPHRTSQVRKPAKRDKDRARRWAGRRWAIPLALIVVILSLYALNPSESNIVYPLIFLSYKIKSPPSREYEYGKGPLDVAFVAFYTLVLFFAREFVMREVLRPLGRSLGIASRDRRALARFEEQAYVAIYTGVVGPLGVLVMRRSPAWLWSTAGMYAGYPHMALPGIAKGYYLVQAAFWAQQALVMLLSLEGRRRDFRELVMHHVVTVALVALSYRFHFTVMGVLVYVTHDISDFFLAVSKSLNYINSPLQGPCYALCIVVWVYLRHYVNLRILASVLTEFGTVGPYVLDWEAGQYKCGISRVITFALLAALQALNLYWLYCLLRNGYRFVAFGVARDDREEEVGEGEGGRDDAVEDAIER